MKPFRVQEEVLKEFEMYVYTTFPILDESLKESIQRKVREERLIWKDIYVSLDKNYVPGCTLSEAVSEGLIKEKTAELFERIEKLYKHQEEALQRIQNNQNVIIATGTGSGKTEAFLIPIIDYCITHPGEKGVKAIIVYPMNALANDQYSRLKDLLAGTDISFGIYTSATPATQEQKPPNALPNERLTREEIQKDPPDILITNYAMLEYLMIRKEDKVIFRHKNLKFIVMDEVHTYSGAKGAEIAMLLRRVKEHSLEEKLSSRGVIHIGTSATVAGGEEERKEVIRFAKSFFGSNFSDDSIIFEKHLQPQPPTDPFTPPMPSLTDDDLKIDPADEEEVRTLARKVLGVEIPDNVPETLYNILGNCTISYTMEKHLTEGIYTLSELANIIREEVPERSMQPNEDLIREVTAHLILGMAAIKDDKRRFRPKIHLFLRGLHGLVRCVNCGEVFSSGVEVCPKCGSLTYPIEVCRHCGKDYYRTTLDRTVEGNRLKPFESFESTEETYHLTKEIPFILPYEENNRSDLPPRLYLCKRCGRVNFDVQTNCPDCGEPMEPFYYIQGKLTTCPVCHGRYGSREVVTPLWSSIAADIAVIATSLLSNLEENERKLLIFSDNRQDSAHQAGYMGDRHVKFTLRQLIYFIAKERKEKGEFPLDIDHMAEVVFERGREIKLFEEPEATAQWKDIEKGIVYRILEELTVVPRLRNTLESLGLITVNYYGLGEITKKELFKEISETFRVDEVNLLKFLKVFLDEMRFKTAVNHELFKRFPTRNELKRMDIIKRPFWKPTGFEFRSEDASGYKLYPFTTSEGRGLFEQITRNLLRVDMPGDFIYRIVKLLEEAGYIVRESIGNNKGSTTRAYLVNYRRMEITVPDEVWVCSSCTKIHTVNIGNKCTTYNCRGELVPKEIDLSDFYVYHYTRHNPVPVKVAEHSGQISSEKREQYESRFKKGDLNVLVCTPTLELGIDIGELSTILLRNIPPSPSNYAQRAGRSGRKTGISLSVAYTRATPHDTYFYEKPSDIISGKIVPPAFNFSNEKILRRHVRSFILEKIDYKMPSLLGDLIEADNRSGEVEFKVMDLEELRNSIDKRRGQIKRALWEVFKGDIENLDFLDGRNFDEYVDEVMDSFVRDLRDVLKPLTKMLTSIRRRINEIMAITNKSRKEQAELINLIHIEGRLLTDSRVAYVYSYLCKVGFLPGYAFPGIQTLLNIPDTPEPIVRDVEFAIREYAPGNFIYVDQMKYAPRYVVVTEEINAADYISGHSGLHYKYCPNCDYATTDTTQMYCPYCNQELSETIHCFEPRMVRAEKVEKVSATEEYRKSTSFDVVRYLIEEGERGGEELHLKGGLILRKLKNAKILITNKGRNENGFKICLKCGSWTQMDDIENWNRYHSQYCDAGEEEIITAELSTIKTSSVALITVPAELFPDMGSFGYGTEDGEETFLITLLHTILNGLYIHLETSPDEVEGFIRRIQDSDGNVSHQIVLYETIPGGVGYIERLGSHWCSILKKAHDVLYNHDCHRACYRCLKNYYNQRVHDRLDKRVIADFLKSVMLECEGLLSSAPEQEDIFFDSPLEKEFYRIFERYGLPKPTTHHYPITDSDGRIVANADFAYPERKIAIFVDGMRYHFDNPKQIQKLLEISNELGILGWTVLRFPTEKILKHPAEVANTLRKALKKNQ